MKVHFPVSCEVAFDYLAEPRNRPEWQASLTGVEGITGEQGVGQRWVDVTRPGLRPAMQTVELDRPHRWAERGAWRGFRAVLALDFAPAAVGCDVAVTMKLTAGGVRAPIALVLDAAAPYAVRADLRRAATMLSRRW